MVHLLVSTFTADCAVLELIMTLRSKLASLCITRVHQVGLYGQAKVSDIFPRAFDGPAILPGRQLRRFLLHATPRGWQICSCRKRHEIWKLVTCCVHRFMNHIIDGHFLGQHIECERTSAHLFEALMWKEYIVKNKSMTTAGVEPAISIGYPIDPDTATSFMPVPKFHFPTQPSEPLLLF